MNREITHYTSPKLEARPNQAKGNYGVFACARIAAGELLIIWGGEIMSYEELIHLPEQQRQHSVQIEENAYLVTVKNPDPGDYINHSCMPNAGLSGQIAVVAMVDIEIGEEVCFDYAMSDGTPYDEFDCGCGTPLCRGRITGNDWRLPELQMRYDGFFSPYLQRRITQQKQAQAWRIKQNGHLVPLK